MFIDDNTGITTFKLDQVERQNDRMNILLVVSLHGWRYTQKRLR